MQGKDNKPTVQKRFQASYQASFVQGLETDQNQCNASWNSGTVLHVLSLPRQLSKAVSACLLLLLLLAGCVYRAALP